MGAGCRGLSGQGVEQEVRGMWGLSGGVIGSEAAKTLDSKISFSDITTKSENKVYIMMSASQGDGARISARNPA